MRKLIYLLIFGFAAFAIGISWRSRAPANRAEVDPGVERAAVAIAPKPQETTAPIAEVEPKSVDAPAAPAVRPKREIHAGDLVIVDEGPIPGARLAARNRQGLAILRKYEKEGFTRSERQELLRRQLVWIVGDGIEARVIEVGAEYLRVRFRDGDDIGFIRKEYVHVKE